MNAATIAVEALLALAVVVVALSCVGMLVMRDFLQRLHYLAPVTTISSVAILAAVVITAGWGQATIKAILISLVLLLNNAVLTHATARAYRVRRHGRWTPAEDEDIAGYGPRQGGAPGDK